MLRILVLFSGSTAAVFTSLMAWLIGRIHEMHYQPKLGLSLTVQIIGAVPFALCFLLNFPMRFFPERATQKILTRHLTFVFCTMMGMIGNLLMVIDMPDEFNSYVTPLWFVFGFTFFYLAGARFLNILLYGVIYFFGLFWGMVSWNVNPGPDEYVSFLLIVFQWSTFAPIAFMSRKKTRDIQHAFKQLGKVFYEHQLKRIRQGHELEETMPTEPSTAFVISFDVISSSKIEAGRAKELFRAVFQRCNAIMSQGYDGRQMTARAYRIKEMGDGFLCSVGYPFHSPNPDLAASALQLAEEFQAAFAEEARNIDPGSSLHCGMGIACGSVSGFYPESPPKEYDLYGHSIVLAKRYEGMRAFLLREQKPASIVILQEDVFHALPVAQQESFLSLDLRRNGLSVRDDPEAERLYYKLLAPMSEALTASA